MKTRFLLLLVPFLAAACYVPAKNCKSFKTGTFEYQTIADGKLMKAKIVRNDSLEIDYLDINNPDTSQIRWVNNCEYILRKYNPKDASEKKTFRMRILETHGASSYTFEFSEVGENLVKEFTATRIPD